MRCPWRKRKVEVFDQPPIVNRDIGPDCPLCNTSIASPWTRRRHGRVRHRYCDNDYEGFRAMNAQFWKDTYDPIKLTWALGYDPTVPAEG